MWPSRCSFGFLPSVGLMKLHRSVMHVKASSDSPCIATVCMPLASALTDALAALKYATTLDRAGTCACQFSFTATHRRTVSDSCQDSVPKTRQVFARTLCGEHFMAHVNSVQMPCHLQGSQERHRRGSLRQRQQNPAGPPVTQQMKGALMFIHRSRS